MDKKIKNSAFLIAVLLILAVGITITGISAYFISQSDASNSINIGNNELTIKETFKNPDIRPNRVTEITKKVEVKNTGLNPAGIRVKAEFSNSDVLTYTEVDYNETDWSYNKNDGYWYYKTPVKPNDSTSPLFNTLTLRNPTAEQVSDFDVYIYAESRNCEENDSLSTIKQLFN
jgi:hypothetical protein